jgi:type IV secretory pathway VirB10-like protein
MREIIARCVVAAGAGMALMVAQGCKKQAAPAPVQSVVVTAPRVQPDFALGPLPFEDDVNSGARQRVEREAPRRQPAQPVQVQAPVQRVDVQAAAVAEAQRLEDARLLEEQEAASERQQEELDQEIEQDKRTQEEMEAEPRIQDIPELPMPAAPFEPMQPQ